MVTKRNSNSYVQKGRAIRQRVSQRVRSERQFLDLWEEAGDSLDRMGEDVTMFI